MSQTNAPSLYDLATAFEPLSPAETRLLDAIPTGRIADCTGLPEHAQIRAEIICWLCINPDLSRLLTPTGLSLRAARVTGTLDLSFATVRVPIALLAVSFRATCVYSTPNSKR